MRLSDQIFVTDINEDWKGIYSPFGHGVAFIYNKFWNNIKNGVFEKVDEKILQYLIEQNIIVEEGFEKAWLDQNYRLPKVQFNSMYLITTMQCNFACKYCVVEKNIAQPEMSTADMSPYIGMKSVDFFKRELDSNPPPEARITFYGGEPMLNKKLISAIVPKIGTTTYSNEKLPIEMVMITNGYVYDEKMTDLFKKYGVGVCISLDGTERHQNITRVTKSNEQRTFKTVIKNYRKYQKAGLSMGISCALGKHNAFDLPEIAEFFAGLQPKIVEFQIPYQVSGEGNALWVSTEDITDNIMEAYKVMDSYGILEGLTFRRLKDFFKGKIRYTDCGSPGSQLVVSPGGSIGPCHSLVGSGLFFEGNVADDGCNPRALANFTQWAARYPFNMTMCQKCPLISLCGGGCTYNSLISNKTIWGKDPQTCKYLEKMMHWVLKTIWEESRLANENN